VGRVVSIADLIAALRPDASRVANGFSPGIAETHDALFARDSADAASILRDWLSRRQICEFARNASATDRLIICAITQTMVEQGDGAIAERLAVARLSWLRRAYAGDADGLVVALVSPRLATGKPDDMLMAVALQFLRLYMKSSDADVDELVVDRVYLGLDRNRCLFWEAPLNFFASQADGRWWHPRRFPGGIAFSINSVGHLVASRALSPAAAVHDARVTIARGAGALRLAAEGSSYQALYDTDVAIPSAFFRDSPAAPIDFAFTAEFGTHDRATRTASWSAAPERRCGCGTIAHIDELSEVQWLQEREDIERRDRMGPEPS
jgi:hypothetical protein